MRRRNTNSRDESVPLIHVDKKHVTVQETEKSVLEQYKNGYRKHWIQSLVDYTP